MQRNQDSEIEQILQSVKAALRKRGLLYKDLAQAIGLSEASVKRLTN